MTQKSFWGTSCRLHLHEVSIKTTNNKILCELNFSNWEKKRPIRDITQNLWLNTANAVLVEHWQCKSWFRVRIQAWTFISCSWKDLIRMTLLPICMTQKKKCYNNKSRWFYIGIAKWLSHKNHNVANNRYPLLVATVICTTICHSDISSFDPLTLY